MPQRGPKLAIASLGGWLLAVLGYSFFLLLLLIGFANSKTYEYSWGHLRALRMRGRFKLSWWVGVAERDAEANAWPEIRVDLPAESVPMSALTEEHCKRAGLQCRQSSDGRSQHATDGSVFVFRDGQLVSWEVPAYWDDKHGLSYSREGSSEHYRFPLTERELKALFGKPRRARARISMS